MQALYNRFSLLKSQREIIMNELTIYRYAYMVANNELDLSGIPYEIKNNVIKKLLDIFLCI